MRVAGSVGGLVEFELSCGALWALLDNESYGYPSWEVILLRDLDMGEISACGCNWSQRGG
jgi:hypothetical protein